MQYKHFVTNALKNASQIANDRFGKVTSTSKPGDNNQVLTETDLEIGNYLLDQINKEFPDHNVIDEEAGVIDRKSPYTWVIDPIDGTSNFAQGVPLYGVMIGLLYIDQPIVGGVAIPEFSEVYYAEKGKGAFCNDCPIRVTKQERLLSSLIAYGIDGHQEKPEITYKECQLLADIILNVRNLRSSNSIYDSALVAKGSYGAEVNRTSKIWDNVARQILIEEAGGIYTEFLGGPLNYTRPLTRIDQNFEYCAAAPVLHKQLQTIIAKSLSK